MNTLAVLALLLLACCVSANPLEESDSLAKLRADLTALQSLTQDKQVAFTTSLVATGSAQTFGPFGAQTPLVFKHVVTNIGNAYSSHTGVFTAPLRGAYHFEWHLQGESGHATAAILVKNSENIFTAYENEKSGWASPSQSATLLLEAGDVVSVHLRKDATVYDDTENYTTFSGHLLFTM